MSRFVFVSSLFFSAIFKNLCKGKLVKNRPIDAGEKMIDKGMGTTGGDKSHYQATRWRTRRRRSPQGITITMAPIHSTVRLLTGILSVPASLYDKKVYLKRKSQTNANGHHGY